MQHNPYQDAEVIAEVGAIGMARTIRVRRIWLSLT
jgi:hypothetical protein